MRRLTAIFALLAACAIQAHAIPRMASDRLLWATALSDGGTWEPTDSASLTHWYDVEHVDMLGIYVTNWPDQSANGFDASVKAGSASSTWVTVQSGGINFDPGSDNALLTESNLPPYTNGMLVVMSVSLDSFGPSCAGRLFEVPVLSASLMCSIDRLRMFVNGSSYDDLAGSFHYDSSTNVVSVWLSSDTNASASALWTNGTLSIESAIIQSMASIAGKQLYFGDNLALSREMDGRFCDVEIYSTTNDRQKAEGYVAHRRGLTALLPAGHPYKETAP